MPIMLYGTLLLSFSLMHLVCSECLWDFNGLSSQTPESGKKGLSNSTVGCLSRAAINSVLDY